MFFRLKQILLDCDRNAKPYQCADSSEGAPISEVSTCAVMLGCLFIGWHACTAIAPVSKSFSRAERCSLDSGSGTWDRLGMREVPFSTDNLRFG